MGDRRILTGLRRTAAIGAWCAVLAIAATTMAVAESGLRPAPASPQPSADQLKPGLGVSYAYPDDIRWLTEAKSWRSYESRIKKGAPLTGFLYADTEAGENVLTSESSERVIAFIDGFMHFEKTGRHELEFYSNDGLVVTMGGVEVYKHDGRHPCETEGPVTVDIAQPGWYAVDVVFFQRLQTACLELFVKAPGEELDFTKPEMYAHIPK
jgi:hypothetical protein